MCSLVGEDLFLTAVSGSVSSVALLQFPFLILLGPVGDLELSLCLLGSSSGGEMEMCSVS